MTNIAEDELAEFAGEFVAAVARQVDREMMRYPMGDNQPTRIDCRSKECVWHRGTKCTNPSPSIVLHSDFSWNCWSRSLVK